MLQVDLFDLVKIWDTVYQPLHICKQHYNSITGLVEVTGFGEKYTSNFISSSLDASLRVWNISSGECLHRIETGLPLLGLSWMKAANFLTFSEHEIMVWNLNRFYTLFNSVGSPIVHLERIDPVKYDHPARIFGVGMDGSSSLFNPRSGEKLVAGFPVMQEVQVTSAVYDIGVGNQH